MNGDSDLGGLVTEFGRCDSGSLSVAQLQEFRSLHTFRRLFPFERLLNRLKYGGSSSSDLGQIESSGVVLSTSLKLLVALIDRLVEATIRQSCRKYLASGSAERRLSCCPIRFFFSTHPRVRIRLRGDAHRFSATSDKTRLPYDSPVGFFISSTRCATCAT